MKSTSVTWFLGELFKKLKMEINATGDDKEFFEDYFESSLFDSNDVELSNQDFCPGCLQIRLREAEIELEQLKKDLRKQKKATLWLIYLAVFLIAFIGLMSYNKR